MQNVSSLVYFSLCQKLCQMTKVLYDMHYKRIERSPDLYKPFTLSQGVLIRLATYACDILSDPSLASRVNLDLDIVELVKSKVSSVITLLLKINNNIVDMRIHPDLKPNLIFATELLLYGVKDALNTTKHLCQKLISYSNVIMKDDFVYFSLAIHKLDFFCSNMQECVGRMQFMLSLPYELVDTMNISAIENEKVSIENFCILEQLGFNKNRYLCYLKDKAISELKSLCNTSLISLGCIYNYDMSVLLLSVLVSTRAYGQSISKGSRLVILDSGNVALINELSGTYIVYRKTVVALPDSAAFSSTGKDVLVYYVSSNICTETLSNYSQETQQQRIADIPHSVLSSSDDEESVISMQNASNSK